MLLVTFVNNIKLKGIFLKIACACDFTPGKNILSLFIEALENIKDQRQRTTKCIPFFPDLAFEKVNS